MNKVEIVDRFITEVSRDFANKRVHILADMLDDVLEFIYQNNKDYFDTTITNYADVILKINEKELD